MFSAAFNLLSHPKFISKFLILLFILENAYAIRLQINANGKQLKIVGSNTPWEMSPEAELKLNLSSVFPHSMTKLTTFSLEQY